MDETTDDINELKDEEVVPNEEKTLIKKPSKFRNLFLFLFTLTIAIFIGYIQIGLFNESNKKGSKDIFREINIPLDEDSHKWYISENFFNKNFLKELEDLTKNTTFSTINILTDAIDSAGEAVPIGHSDCDHPFMSINANRSLCHIPQRIDVGNHFIVTGGFNSYMESYEKMVARILVFHNRFNNLIKKYKIDEQFNKNEKFLNYAKLICKNEYKNFDTLIPDLYHFDLILLIAGQGKKNNKKCSFILKTDFFYILEVPMHLDVPYFMGADRSTLPQWLLVMMKQSKLFDNLYIPDLKGVLWLSEHKNKPDVDGGHFYMFPAYKTDMESQTKKLNDNYIMLESVYNRAILFDGSRIIHGVDRFKPNKIPKFLNRNQQYHIKYDENENYWHLYDTNNNIVESYTDDDVQLSVVWRTHCFENENEKNEFYSETKRIITIDDIAETFKTDLKSKNKLPTQDIKYLDLWTIVIKEYLMYPLNSKSRKYLNLFSFNYCLLPNLMPKCVNKYLDPFLKTVC
jgi:hypothetical protein